MTSKASRIYLPGGADAVCAVLAGRKTQSRWPIDPQPKMIGQGARSTAAGISAILCWPDGKICGTADCPIGQVGDLLWVMETWHNESSQALVRYKASGDDLHALKRWKSPIHMPRWASRITLRITDVRQEQVQKISEEDAIAEGMTGDICQSLFERIAGRHKEREECWLEDENTNEWISESSICRKCAEAELKKHEHAVIRSAYDNESDGPAYCDTCGHALSMSLTEYGIEREMFLESDHPKNREFFPTMHPRDARIMELIADGINDFEDRHRLRLAKIGFATLWDSINVKRGFPWLSNPWDWALTYERTEVAGA